MNTQQNTPLSTQYQGLAEHPVKLSLSIVSSRLSFYSTDALMNDNICSENANNVHTDHCYIYTGQILHENFDPLPHVTICIWCIIT